MKFECINFIQVKNVERKKKKDFFRKDRDWLDLQIITWVIILVKLYRHEIIIWLSFSFDLSLDHFHFRLLFIYTTKVNKMRNIILCARALIAIVVLSADTRPMPPSDRRGKFFCSMNDFRPCNVAIYPLNHNIFYR